ncbi:hypothetical protein ACFWR6_24470 [Streptomyces griseus]|uniref:hypothetical protein n=1 Tax=Streptomyces griseus TaxID=1911 RepID=UPI00365AE61D
MTSDPYDLDVRVGASADPGSRDEHSGSRAGQGLQPAAEQAGWPMTSTTLHPLAGARSAAAEQGGWPMTSHTMHPLAGAQSTAVQAGWPMTSHTMHPLAGA